MGWKSTKPLKSSSLLKGGGFIKKKSEKFNKKEEKYNHLKKDYLTNHPICEFPGCTSTLVEIHHKKGRVGENMFKYFMSVCRLHHRYIHDNVKESFENGWLLK